MALPAELLQAVSAQGGGKIALVIGAGCSIESPTNLPPASEWAVRELHRRLVADTVLSQDDCSDPEDLSAVADAVYDKTNSQRAIVDLLCGYELKSADPNEGYRTAAAMLAEGVISSIVTLNFDLALTNALSGIGAGGDIGVIERPEELLGKQKIVNIYYLHRNVNASDPELWVLRSAALSVEWKERWEEAIAKSVLTAPVIVFAGLGTPVGVLITSTCLLRGALPAATQFYQVDPADKSKSAFFNRLALDPSAYIQCGWCQFMQELSQRLVEEHVHQLSLAAKTMTQGNHLPNEDISGLLACMRALGLVKLGQLRASWLLHKRRYCPVLGNIPPD